MDVLYNEALNIRDDLGNYDISSINDSTEDEIFLGGESNHANAQPEVLDDTVENSVQSVTVHRGMAYHDLIKCFMALDKDTDIRFKKFEVTMVLQNGNVEAAEDNGGVLRDCLAEFWETFYEKNSLGASIKVPALSPSMTTGHWQAIAKIIVIGYKQEQYFPVQLAPCFMQSILYGQCPEEELLQMYLQYLPPVESDTLSKAISDFEAVDIDDVMEIMDAHEVRELPTKDNLQIILGRMAHKELIQQPAYVAKCWSDILKKQLLPIMKLDICQLRQNLLPCTKRVLNMLEFSSELTNKERCVANLLKKYIKSLSHEMLKLFLRFCTGMAFF